MVKIERSFPAPESLEIESRKVNGSYTGSDVVERLREDFHDKCYICGLKGLQDPQVEHLLPHKNGKYPDRKFDWENLFWVCGHCNNVKNQKKYETGILDCCKRDPEDVMNFLINENEVTVEVKDLQDQEAVLAAQLVYEVFNLKNTEMRIVKSDKRLKELQREMNVLYSYLEAYRRNPNSKKIVRTLKALIRRNSAFAGFKRCYIRMHQKEYPDIAVEL